MTNTKTNYTKMTKAELVKIAQSLPTVLTRKPNQRFKDLKKAELIGIIEQVNMIPSGADIFYDDGELSYFEHDKEVVNHKVEKKTETVRISDVVLTLGTGMLIGYLLCSAL